MSPTVKYQGRPHMSDVYFTTEELAIFRGLERWFTENRPALSELCMQAFPQAPQEDAIYLMRRPLSLYGSDIVAYALDLWADGEELAYIQSACQSGTVRDWTVAKDFACRVEQDAPRIAAFLGQWADSASGDAEPPVFDAQNDLP